MADNQDGAHIPEWVNPRKAERTHDAVDIDHTAIDSLVDFELANTVARRLMKPGPVMGRDEITGVVDELRSDAVLATGHVSRVTGLVAAPGERVASHFGGQPLQPLSQVEVLRGQAEEHFVAHNASVVHHNIEAAKGVHGLLHHALGTGVISHRVAIGRSLATGLHNLVDHGLCGIAL